MSPAVEAALAINSLAAEMTKAFGTAFQGMMVEIVQLRKKLESLEVESREFAKQKLEFEKCRADLSRALNEALNENARLNRRIELEEEYIRRSRTEQSGAV